MNTWFVETQNGKREGLSYAAARDLFSAELRVACDGHFIAPNASDELHAKAMAHIDAAAHKEFKVGPRNNAWFVKIDDATRIEGVTT